MSDVARAGLRGNRSYDVGVGEEPLEARQLAQNMGIEHYVADEREAFREVIVQNFIDEYRQGRTPILV